MFRFTESRNSRSSTLEPSTYTLRYTAAGSGDHAYIRSYALAATPAVVWSITGNLFRQNVTIEWVGYQIARVEVTYGEQKQETGSYRLSFDTSGATINLKYSKETVSAYPGGVDKDKFQNLIGVNGDNVEGADVVIPALKITVHFRHPLGVIGLPTIKNLARATGKINSGTFLTFAAREVLFLGATGQEGSETETEVAYQYAMSENADGLTIGDIVGIAKAGWDLVWIRYKDEVVGDTQVKQPKEVFVERVYDATDFPLIFGFGG
jgi:hypothetical protein